MIRLILVATFVVLFLLFSIPLLIFEYFLGKFNQSAKDKSSLAIVNWAFSLRSFFCPACPSRRSARKCAKDVPALYIGNHRSYFDILLTYVRVPRPTGYIARKKCSATPFW